MANANNGQTLLRQTSVPECKIDSSNPLQRTNSFPDANDCIRTTQATAQEDQPASPVEPNSIFRSVLTLDIPPKSEARPSESGDTVTTAENEIEARKVYNNHMVSVKVWVKELPFL